MVEVFKTNVTNNFQATKLVGVIEGYFDGCKANFDLDDCDHVLRIERRFRIDNETLISLLKDMGVTAEVLPDEAEGFDFLLPSSRLIIR